MVCAPRCWVDEAASNTCNEETVVDLELDGVFEGLLLFFQHLIEAFGLGNSSRKTVEDESGVWSKHVRSI